eukprot:jgi/Botrbrau1/18950/Bobra.0522s0002.1
MNKRVASICIALIAASQVVAARTVNNQDAVFAAYTHTRGVKQNGKVLNNIASSVNNGIKTVTFGKVDPVSNVILGNGTATANLNVITTGIINPNNTKSTTVSAGFTNNTAYTYGSQLGVQQNPFNSNTKLTASQGGIAVGNAVGGAQAGFQKLEVVANSTALKNIETFQISSQIKPGTNSSLFGFSSSNLNRNTSNSFGTISQPYPGTASQVPVRPVPISG